MTLPAASPREVQQAPRGPGLRSEGAPAGRALGRGGCLEGRLCSSLDGARLCGPARQLQSSIREARKRSSCSKVPPHTL